MTKCPNEQQKFEEVAGTPEIAKAETHNSGNRIRFPAPPYLGLEPGQEIVFNGIHATIRQTEDGQLEISDQAFIEQLIKLGFSQGRNNTPERIQRILQHVPEEYRQDFLNGVMGGYPGRF